MRRMRWIACLWPGLPLLWTFGSWSGLFLALVTAIILDLLVLVGFGWSELLSENFRIIGWTAFGVFWVVAWDGGGWPIWHRPIWDGSCLGWWCLRWSYDVPLRLSDPTTPIENVICE